jgi:hypothetical protein
MAFVGCPCCDTCPEGFCSRATSGTFIAEVLLYYQLFFYIVSVQHYLLGNARLAAAFGVVFAVCDRVPCHVC